LLDSALPRFEYEVEIMRMGGICFALMALLPFAACSSDGGSGTWPDGYVPPGGTTTDGGATSGTDTSGAGPGIPGAKDIPGTPSTTDKGSTPTFDPGGTPTPIDATILGDKGTPQPGDIPIVGDAPAGLCDPITGSGCQQGSHCAYNEAGQIACARSGPRGPGETCGGAEGCKLGQCSTLPGISEDPLCYTYCNVPGDCIEGFTCAGVENQPFKLCVPKPPEVTCNLLAQDCEKEGQACFLLQDQSTGENKYLCVDSMGVQPGQPCQYANACTAGYLCINSACTKVCDLSAEVKGCAEGENCQSFAPSQNVGVCVAGAPPQ